MQIEPIGYVRSCFGDKFGVPRQPGLCPSSWGELVFAEAFRSAEAVRGLDGFSHVWLMFGFHLTAGKGWSPTVRPPRLGGNKRVGVFASRSTFRPNGLGLSLALLEGIDHDRDDGPVLKLGGIDIVDGTPVYDVKPYLPYAEALPDAAAGFAADAIERLEVVVDDAAADAYAALPSRTQALVMEALALDPRPAVQAVDDGRVFGALLGGHNIRFTVAGGVCRILGVGDSGELP